ncbi:hypothetical protein MRX96_012130 [Rhipicephalus microplus]
MSLPRLFTQVLIGTLLIPLPGFFNASRGLPKSIFYDTVRCVRSNGDVVSSVAWITCNVTPDTKTSVKKRSSGTVPIDS